MLSFTVLPDISLILPSISFPSKTLIHLLTLKNTHKTSTSRCVHEELALQQLQIFHSTTLNVPHSSICSYFLFKAFTLIYIPPFVTIDSHHFFSSHTLLSYFTYNSFISLRNKLSICSPTMLRSHIN